MGQGLINANGLPNFAPANLVLSATAFEDITKRYIDPTTSLLHTAIHASPIIATSVPSGTPLSVWIDHDDGDGDVYIETIAYPGGLFTFDVDEFSPLNPAHVNWILKIAIGSYGPASPVPAGYASAAFTVTAAGAVSPASISSIHFVLNPLNSPPDPFNYTHVDPGQYFWDIFDLEWTQPTFAIDPFYMASFFTIQLGHTSTGTCTITGGVNVQSTAGAGFSLAQAGYEVHIGGGVFNTLASVTDATHATLSTPVSNGAGQGYEIWNPAPDAQGQNEDPTNSTYLGRLVTDSTNLGQTGAGVTVVYKGVVPPPWPVPSPLNPDGSVNLNVTYRTRVYAVSVLSQNSFDPQPAGQVFTLCTGWPGGADHYDVTPNPQTPPLNLNRSNPNTVGGGLQVAGSALGANTGYTMTINGAGQIVLQNLPEVFTLPLLPSTAYPAGSVVLDTSDHKIYRNPTGNSWLNSSDPQDLVAGAISTGVTIAAFQVSAGVLQVGVEYAGQIQTTQLVAGTALIAAALIESLDVSQITSHGVLTVDAGGLTISYGGNSILFTPAAPGNPAIRTFGGDIDIGSGGIAASGYAAAGNPGLSQVTDVALFPSGAAELTFTHGILTGYSIIA